MKDFPKWLLALAFVCIVPLFVSPFYLFGAITLVATPDNGVLRFGAYVLQNLLWLAPILCFFVGLDRYRRGFHKSGVAVVGIGVALTVAAVLTVTGYDSTL
jgi:hypothetical protein